MTTLNRLFMIVAAFTMFVGGGTYYYLESESRPPLKGKDLGKHLVESSGCVACHKPDMSFRAPKLVGSYGRMRELSDGTEVKVDEDYLRESLLYPGKKLAMGYQNTMPSYKDSFTSEEIESIVAYIVSLKDKKGG